MRRQSPSAIAIIGGHCLLLLWPDPHKTLWRPHVAIVVASTPETLAVPWDSPLAIPEVVFPAIPRGYVSSDPMNRLLGALLVDEATPVDDDALTVPVVFFTTTVAGRMVSPCSSRRRI